MAQTRVRGQNKKSEPPPAQPVRPPPAQPVAPPPQQTLSVSGFAPTSGPVGLKVTISGRGFMAQTKVVFGGRPVATDSISDSAIVFTVPARFKDGGIVLRHPGAANDIVVGTFQVVPPPVLVSFLPASGAVGMRVTLNGSGFAPGDQVLLGQTPVAIVELAPTRVVVTIPAGAVSDFFVLARPGTGIKTQSRSEFTVALPGPTISGFAPESGPVGTIVRITGANFSPEDKVYLGKVSVAIDSRQEGFLSITIPATASKDDVLSVRGPRGDSTAQKPFVLVHPAAIQRFVPAYGVAGTKVEIQGQHFRAGDEIRLGARPLKVLTLDEGKITVEIPADAPSERFQILRSGQPQSQSPTMFEVVVAPTVQSFHPPGGPGGTKVTITGTGFGPETVVKYGAGTLRIVGRTGATSIEVVLSASATASSFIVQTKGGEVSSSQAFQVFVYSTLSGIAPESGPAGTRILFRGSHFDATDSFYLNNQLLPVAERKPDGCVVTVPAGAQSGSIAWESHGKRQTSAFQFAVLQPIAVTAVAPAQGPAGSQVTITGTNFTARSTVLFGKLPCAIVKREGTTQIVVTLPAAARGQEHFYVDDTGQHMKSAQPFQVVTPPAIASLNPLYGPPGTQVTLFGSQFGAGAKVFFAGLECQILRREGGTALVVAIPAGAQGKDYFWVEDAGQRVRAPQAFEVLAAPAAPPDPSTHPTHEHAHDHPHPVGDHHHHPHTHPHKPGTNHHHPY
jgi:hypothetical protein